MKATIKFRDNNGELVTNEVYLHTLRNSKGEKWSDNDGKVINVISDTNEPPVVDFPSFNMQIVKATHDAGSTYPSICMCDECTGIGTDSLYEDK